MLTIHLMTIQFQAVTGSPGQASTESTVRMWAAIMASGTKSPQHDVMMDSLTMSDAICAGSATEPLTRHSVAVTMTW